MVEEVIPFLEENVKILAAERGSQMGVKTFFGKRDGTLPAFGELNVDIVAHALSKIMKIDFPHVPQSYTENAAERVKTGAPERTLTFCPGCPHRASFWSIHTALTAGQA